ACFKQKKIFQKNCTQIDAMNSRYTSRIIAKLGGTRPFNSTYGHLLQGYGGVTYNTSQAIIDIRFHKNILSRINEISIPERTNVKKIIRVRFIRISILETNDNYSPFNVTVSIKGCFYRKYSTKKHIQTTTKPT